MQFTIDIQPVQVFNYELSCIEDSFYYDMVVSALNKVPAYFFVAPASTTGKYHPKSSLGIGGLVRHTKALFRISEELFQNKGYASFPVDERDEIRVALLLHDAVKQGVTDEGEGYTVDIHPRLVRKALQPYDNMNEQQSSAWHNICSYIETHHGVWNTNRMGNEILDLPKSKAQKHVHLCDYLASRRCIEVDTSDPDTQAAKEQSREWRRQLATEGQVEYIKKLVFQSVERGITHKYGNLILVQNGQICINKGEADEVIKGLKKLLGY